jgi:predicted ribosomally synthesized peptide with nif11-like leader
MSKADMARFVEDANSNQTLRNALTGKSGVPEIVAVANEHGYHITEADIHAYAEEQKAGLSEKELEGVVGGRISIVVPRIIIYVVLGL